jgi:hypothetical protein
MAETHKEGTLEKQSKSLTWESRFVVLRGGTLQLYTVADAAAAKKTKPQHTIVLSTSYIQSNAKRGPTVFVVRTEKGKDFTLRALDASQKVEWVRAMRAAGTKEASFAGTIRYAFLTDGADDLKKSSEKTSTESAANQVSTPSREKHTYTHIHIIQFAANMTSI